VLALLLGPLVPLANAQAEGGAEPIPAPGHTTPLPSEASLGTLNLAECLALAGQRQPRIAAQRASLAAAEDGRRALEALSIPALLDREIPVRRRQAALGVTAATAALDQAERETVYAVTRTYFTVLYARQQEGVARTVVERLSAAHEAAELAVKSGSREVTATDVNRAAVYLRLARTRRIQAAQGVKRALAALKEAIGLGPDADLDVAAGRLHEPSSRPSRDDVIALALARRGELVQASVLTDVTGLEVEAQGTSHHLKMQTFAAGSDIHARQIPQGIHNAEYRPGAQPPEMPTLLVGSRAERVKHAESLHARADAELEETRNLIALEAEDAFLRWEEASREAPEALVAADTGDKLADDLTKQFTSGLKVKVEEVVNAQVLASQARSQFNEYLFHEILALADLERITAGAFCAGLIEAVAQAQPVPENSNGAR
jgi:outer membrane protein TolC